MMKTNLFVILCGLFVTTGIANAECPSSMNKDELTKCQGIEKSGVNYQEWQMKQKEMAGDSTISPITGKDVRDAAPAAGKEKTDSKPAK
ncbi:MAG TPA: hypothetical protein VIQ03_03930 [Gammaproteobacteria bacterium]